MRKKRRTRRMSRKTIVKKSKHYKKHVSGFYMKGKTPRKGTSPRQDYLKKAKRVRKIGQPTWTGDLKGKRI